MNKIAIALAHHHHTSKFATKDSVTDASSYCHESRHSHNLTEYIMSMLYRHAFFNRIER